MKNLYIESLRREAREYHRNHQWRLQNGLFIPHAYPEENRKQLSWWDDVGFILNKRRVMVNWRHPRCAYQDAIEKVVTSEIAQPAEYDGWREGGEQIYRKLGRSRKKIVGITHSSPTPGWSDYFAAFRAREEELMLSGIDLDIRPAMRVSWCYWATLVDLIAPIEVRSNDDVVKLASIARRLLKRETSVAGEWPGYSYGRNDWLAEAEKRKQRG